MANLETFWTIQGPWLRSA